MGLCIKKQNKLIQLHQSIMFPLSKFGYLWQQANCGSRVFHASFSPVTFFLRGGSWGVPRPDEKYNLSSRLWVYPGGLFPIGSARSTSKGRCLGDILTSAQATSTSSLQHAGESAPRSQSLSPTSLRPQKQWNSPTVLEKRGCLKQASSSILKSYWTSRLVQHQQYCRYCTELSRWRARQAERLRHTNPSMSQPWWNLGNDQKVANTCSRNDSMVAGLILRERVRSSDVWRHCLE